MTGALDGLRVVDLSQIVSGPMAACILADQGADVIKVESPGGDPVRGLGPGKADLSAMFITVNRGKRSLALDLKHPQAAPILAALIAQADVLIENFRPGVLDRLGFGYDVCAAINPRLIYASITGFGADGPYANIRVYDPVVQAVSGIAATQTDRDGKPSLVKSLIADKVTALTAAQAITAALCARERGGTGQRLDIAMLDAAVAFNWPDGMYNHTFLDDAPPPWPEYGAAMRLRDAADGQVAVGALQTAEFRALCGALGLNALGDDPRFATARGRMQHQAEWAGAVATAIAVRDLDTLMAGFIAQGAVGGRVNGLAAVTADPQVVHNGIVAAIDHGALGRVASPRPAARFAATPALAPRPAPCLGEHSRAILRELGRSAAEIDTLIGAAVVQVPSATL